MGRIELTRRGGIETTAVGCGPRRLARARQRGCIAGSEKKAAGFRRPPWKAWTRL